MPRREPSSLLWTVAVAAALLDGSAVAQQTSGAALQSHLPQSRPGGYKGSTSGDRSAASQHQLHDGQAASSSPLVEEWLRQEQPLQQQHHLSQQTTKEPRHCAPGSGDPAASSAVAALVVVACNRPSYLQRCLYALQAVNSASARNAQDFPLFVSLGCQHAAVLQVAAAFAANNSLQILQSHDPTAATSTGHAKYGAIARHYRFVLEQVFDCRQFTRLVLFEDDMEPAVDFFDYFRVTAPLLEADPGLWCVSSWNDHGLQHLVGDPRQLHRTDWFPGLGWMLTRQLWEGELRHHWPDSYWDDWMRQPDTRRGRQCIRPEVCRTYNFGAQGASAGQFYSRYIEPVKLNTEPVDWDEEDLSYLQAGKYELQMQRWLAAAQLMPSVAAIPGRPSAQQQSGNVTSYKLLFHSQQHYEELAGSLHMLPEWRFGVARAAYHNTVIVRLHGAMVFLQAAPDYARQLAAGNTDSAGKGAQLRHSMPVHDAAKTRT